MSLHTMTETCACGAVFTGSSTQGPISLSYMAKQWRKDHICPLRQTGR